MKPQQITGAHHILFNYKNGASKAWTTSKTFERFEFNDKGYIKNDNIECLCADEHKRYNLKSATITHKGETSVKLFV